MSTVGTTHLPSHFLDHEYFVLVKLLVQGELPRLSEGLGAALIGTFERLLTCVNVHVLLEVLTESKVFATSQTCVLLRGRMCGLVASQGKPGREGLVTAGICLASEWLFHFGLAC